MKIDFKKQLKKFYNAPSKAPVLIDVPVMNYLMVDGKAIQIRPKVTARRLKHYFLFPMLQNFT